MPFNPPFIPVTTPNPPSVTEELPLAVGVGIVGMLSNLSRKGFLLLLGDVNGLDRPMVANFCPLLSALFLFLLFSSMEVLMKGFVVEVVVDVTPPVPALVMEKGFVIEGGFSLD